ncbi:MAG: hypothetical protein IKW58_01090 [Alphaproteobacteria bacterium]|nr:hypothetical protein [Alphaproteobacteria bacterium]
MLKFILHFFPILLQIKEIKYFITPSMEIPKSGICYTLGGFFHKIYKNKRAFRKTTPNTNLIIILPNHINLKQDDLPNKVAHIFLGAYQEDNNIYNKSSQTIELEDKLDSKSLNFINQIIQKNNLQTLILKELKTNKIYQIKRR